MNNTRARIQAFGGFLTGMVIPCMGVFIAWGFITALFIESGWIPNAQFAQIVSPMSKYLLPTLIAFIGGKQIYDVRGGMIGAAATFGLIVGADIPMFLGAMIMGPFSAWVLKKFDQLIKDRISGGFEMVVNNFSLGIIGMILCLASYAIVGPVITAMNNAITVVVQAVINTGFLPLLAVINEPAKVLFLNNVIDQGIYYPLGMQAALTEGKSILFMVASNPGAGLGLLLAFSIFGKGDAKDTAPGAIIVHFFGGIHEIYYPYILMRPITILGMIAGSAAGIFTFTLFDVGLVAGPSPGSFIAYMALTPKGNFVGVIAGVLAAAVVSFLINSIFVRSMKVEDADKLEETRAQSKAMKQEGQALLKAAVNAAEKPEKKEIRFIAFACDAGLGSSAMGATNFKKRLMKAGIELPVEHYAIEKVPADADVIVVHKNLYDRAVKSNPDKRIISLGNYLKDENLDKLFEEIAAMKEENKS